MNLLVLAAGIADPKWPLEWPDDGAPPARRAERVIASPFDEAALELALRARDQGGGAHTVSVLVASDGEGDRLARTLAAYAVPVTRLAPPRLDWWNARAVGAALASAIESLDCAPTVVMLGREFGDYDDGAVPAWLAARLGRPYFALAQDVAAQDGEIRFKRERGEAEEVMTVDRPLVISVTNDRRNRLRRPLMKNVMAAKQMTLATLQPPQGEGGAGLDLRRASIAESPRAAGGGRMLSGPVEQQVAQLADALMAWRASQ